jgi:hypothetical protein
VRAQNERTSSGLQVLKRMLGELKCMLEKGRIIVVTAYQTLPGGDRVADRVQRVRGLLAGPNRRPTVRGAHGEFVADESCRGTVDQGESSSVASDVAPDGGERPR